MTVKYEVVCDVCGKREDAEYVGSMSIHPKTWIPIRESRESEPVWACSASCAKAYWDRQFVAPETQIFSAFIEWENKGESSDSSYWKEYTNMTIPQALRAWLLETNRTPVSRLRATTNFTRGKR